MMGVLGGQISPLPGCAPPLNVFDRYLRAPPAFFFGFPGRIAFTAAFSSSRHFMTLGVTRIVLLLAIRLLLAYDFFEFPFISEFIKVLIDVDEFLIDIAHFFYTVDFKEGLQVFIARFFLSDSHV